MAEQRQRWIPYSLVCVQDRSLHKMRAFRSRQAKLQVQGRGGFLLENDDARLALILPLPEGRDLRAVSRCDAHGNARPFCGGVHDHVTESQCRWDSATRRPATSAVINNHDDARQPS